MASHEFRSPLATILSSVFLLENYSGSSYDEIKSTHLGRIKKAIGNLNSILDNYLLIGRLEEGKFNFAQSGTQVEEIIRDVVSDMLSLKKEGQEIHYEAKGTPRIVFLDKQLFRNALVNLVSNAIKYSPANGIIQIKSDYADDNIVVEVIDNGIGIPADEQRHVFERFFRATNASGMEGTGLGLHIVKKYMELMHGSINFRSTDAGTTFTIIIPY